jgi:DNA-binding PadR family transcriptional regulator
MKTLLRSSLFASLALLFLLTAHKEGFAMVKNIHWLGHDTFKITGEKVIYPDHSRAL